MDLTGSGNPSVHVMCDRSREVYTTPILTAEEYTQIVCTWNATTFPHPKDLCVYQLFAQQAARTPDAIAVVSKDASLSYRTLGQRANRLAHKLRALGVGPDVLVGVCLSRSVEMAVAVLGVLAAGGAYVPLDPSYPQERLAFLCQDTQTPILLTERALLGKLPKYEGQRICVEELEQEALTKEAKEEALGSPENLSLPHHLGYVIYTSGSTGRPKGICMPQAALVNLCLWHQRTLRAGARTLQFASLCFDASFHELFAAWSTGGSVYFITEELRRNTYALTHFVHEHAIEKVILPGVVLQQMAEHHGHEPTLFRSLREIIVTGEQLHITSPVVRLFEQLPECTLHNHYGPSETHVVTAFSLTGDPQEWPTHPPIGRPIDNCTAYILDQVGQPVPVGVIGELYLGGVGLARCYLRRPELTAERFVGSPFDSDSSARLYKTGDLARHLPDGNIEFLGRIDHQVKIRGFRVELGEIESVLGRHEAVLEVVVMAREDTPGDRRLAAYVKAQPGKNLTVAALRTFLESQLPDYMVPAAFVFLEALPLTENGKVDRRALPAPSRVRPVLASPYVAPRSSLEERLCAIYCEVLQLDEIGVDDNFLELGGDSLGAVRIFARIRESLRVEFPFEHLFSFPTIAEIAPLLTQALASELRTAPIPIVSRATPLPLSFAQERMWFLHRLAKESPAYHCHYSFRVLGPLHRTALQAAMSALWQRHEILRTTFVQEESEPRQHLSTRAQPVLAQLDLQTLSALQQEVALQRELSAQIRRPFDLTTGPLLRAGVITLDPQQHVLWWTLHHIITDGRSMEVYFHELAMLYRAFEAGSQPVLPPLSIQYADYAAWDRQTRTEQSLREHLQFWKAKLQDIPPLLELPADHPRPAHQSFCGATLRGKLSRALCSGLRTIGTAQGATLSMVLLAGLSVLSHRQTGQERFLIGIPSLGRDRVETESLLGFFVNILPIRVDVSGNPSFEQLVQRIRIEVLEAFAHDSVPFERLVQELQIERSASHSPLIQLALAPQPLHERDLQLGALRVERIDIESHRAAFDVTLYVWEDEAGCELCIEYNTDLFLRSTMERFLRQLQSLLEGAALAPQRSVSLLPLLSTEERQELQHKWSQGERTLDGQRSFPELFAAQAQATPDALALLECGGAGRAWSYAELDQRANQLARQLRSLGVGPEVLVALCTERSAESVLGILGVLKAGGAYVPFDPDYPRERLALMMEDCVPSLILTQAAQQNRLPQGAAQVVVLDADWAEIAKQSDAALDRVEQPSSLAYVIYTSGSTGRPKGVAVEHRNLSNLAVAQREAFGITPSDRVLQFASLCFDASVSEIVTTLTAGATLCLLPPGPPTLGAELGRLIKEQRISLVTLPPSVLFHLPVDHCTGLRTLIVAGESCSPALVERWAATRRFINAYGPTECTVCATLADCTAEAGSLPPPPPIGRPLANVEVYVLDAHQQLVPIGTPGELYIGGAGVARGYLGRPELTQSRFVPSPFASDPQARLYRTGDLVRWRSDGNLEFLGRIDDQVKVHGFRIELGEIESVLCAQPEVAEAVVVAQELDPGDKDLVAYIVPRNAPAPRPIELWPSIAEYFVYDDLIYFALSSDERRNQVYRQSLARCVVGKTVLEVGTGAEAILARMCIEQGARKVYAIEILEDSYRKATQRIAELGLSDRIVVIHGDAIDVTLPELAEVCVSEIVGAIGGSEAAAYIMNRARHLLTADARMIPERSVTRVAAISLPESFMDAPSFTPVSAHYTRKIFEQVGRRFDLRLCLRGVTEEQLLSDVGVFEDLDFRAEVPLTETHEVTLRLHKGGPLSGLLVWLNLYTLDDDCIDILKHEHSWIPVFLPVFGHNIQVAAGTEVRMRIARTLCENGRNPDYHIEGMLCFPDGQQRPFHYTAAHFGTDAGSDFQHNPFYARLFAEGGIAERALPGAGGAGDPAQLGEGERTPATLTTRLRTQLERQLPRHMIPSFFLYLEKLPLAPTGKVNRRALPLPNRSPAACAPQHAATPLEQRLAALWCEFLRVDSVNRNDSFFALGGHSLLAARMILRIQDVMGIELPLRALYESPTLAGLLDRMERVQLATEADRLCFSPDLQLAQEAQLAESIRSCNTTPSPAGDIEQIFLTGATGYIGVFLLAELLHKTESRVRVYCLVRASNRPAARQRLHDSLVKYGLWTDSFAERIEPVLGDLAVERFGLSLADFAQLAGKLDVIFHCGAQVDHIRGYHHMKGANVLGTHEVLRLASQGKRKQVHHLSTLSVLYPPSFVGAGVVREEDVAGPLPQLPNGYMQSKCVAEQLVSQALARGIPAAIYRLGAITGHSQSGVCNERDYFYSALRTSALLGAADDLNTDQTPVPVDDAVRAIVALALRATTDGKVFHICPEQPLFWFDLLKLLRDQGHRIALRSYRECMDILRRAAQAGSDAPMVAFIPFLFQMRAGSTRYVLEDYYAPVRYDCRNTVAGLAEAGAAPLPAPSTFILRYIEYLQQQRLLPDVPSIVVMPELPAVSAVVAEDSYPAGSASL